MRVFQFGSHPHDLRVIFQPIGRQGHGSLILCRRSAAEPDGLSGRHAFLFDGHPLAPSVLISTES